MYLNRTIIKYTFLLFSLLFIWELRGINRINGLSFYSHESNRDRRTSLNLTPDKPFHFSKGFTLSFDLCLHSRADAYGYILRIIGDDDINFDLLSSVPQLVDNYDVNNREFFFIIKNQTVIHFRPEELLFFESGEWIHIELTFNYVADRITVIINGTEQTVSYDFNRSAKYQLFFGSNNYKEFATLDVPPMSIKDVRLLNHHKKPVYHWRMDKNMGNEVFDEYKQARATVVNPIWETDDYTKWKKVKSFRFPNFYLSFPQITWDKYGKRFFFADLNTIYTFHVETAITDTIKPLSGVPFYVRINQLCYDYKSDELVFYEFDEDKLDFFNFQTGQWTQDTANVSYLSHYRHHSASYDEDSKTVYTMGGYGFYQYSSLFQINDGKSQQWTRHDLSKMIHPRYLASMGRYQDSLFLYFGGYGNESGRQQESPHNYYDLYAINKNNLHVNKLWELEKPENPYLNSNSLIINKENELFYVLTFNNNMYETYALLREYRIDKPYCRIIGDSILFYFSDVESFCNLYLPDDETILYALTSYVKDGEKIITIYSIAYPPLSYSDILQVSKQKSSLGWMIAVLAGLLLAGLFYYFRRRHKKKEVVPIPTKAGILEKNHLPEDQATEIVEVSTEKDVATNEDNLFMAQQSVFPSINMLGEFTIFNSANENLMQQFTPTTKQLLLLLILYTLNKKGVITSQEIQNALWENKDHESARNNRNVYLNKLRLLLTSLKEVKIQNKKTLWYILFDSKIYIDYEDVRSSIRLMGQSTLVDKNKLNRLLEIIKKGKLLPFFEYEWLDDYKTDYSDMVIDFLYKMSENPEIKNDYNILSAIADAILIQDNIDEKGIRIKCNALVKLGKQNQAVQVFKKYCDDYKKLLGEKPDVSFDMII